MEKIRNAIWPIANKILNRPVYNFFSTNFGRTALISYVVAPFRLGPRHYHTNTAEVLEIAKTFRDLGYNVDAVNYDFAGTVNYEKYKIILGFGDPLIESFARRKHKIITIYYGTGMHIDHQNKETLRRVEDVFHKKGVWLLDSGRIVDRAYSVQTTLVDAMITLGNDIVVESYARCFRRKIYQVPISFFEVLDPEALLLEKHFSEARNHFLWFGGGGMIHKGLDLLLDVFRELPGLSLHVCGPLDTERRFKDVYHRELYETQNIHTHGFVRIDSPLFKDLLTRCAFVIFPSCAEGGAGSVVCVMGNGGLIPVLTKESSIDLKDYGIPIRGMEPLSVRSAVLAAAEMEPSEIEARSHRCAKSVRADHSLGSYARHMKNALNEIIEAVK